MATHDTHAPAGSGRRRIAARRARAAGAGLALAAAALRVGATPPIDWDFRRHLDADALRLIDDYVAAAREHERLALELGARFAQPLVGLEVARDLRRLRWRGAGDPPGRWRVALICPQDRASLARVEGVLAERSARRGFVPLALRGDRLLTSESWEGRAWLLRADGTAIRLFVLD